jgi:hypothetical protein
MKHDAYARYARDTAYVDFHLSGKKIGVLVELRERAQVNRVNAALGALGNIARIAKIDFATGDIDVSALCILDKCHEVLAYEIASPLRVDRAPIRYTDQAAMVRDESESRKTSPAKGSVVLGVIDTGFPFSHEALRKRVANDRGGTRIAAIWDQDRIPAFGDLGDSRCVAYGSVLSRKTMDRAITENTQNGVLDEGAVYRSVAYRELDARATHGSHVLGLLATHRVDDALCFRSDDSSGVGVADVLAVQLPRYLLSSPSRAAACRAILDGIAWMLGQIKPSARLVVAVPYGSTLGSHDGLSLFEKALDALIAANRQRLSVVLPSGNVHDSQLHAEIAVKALHASNTLIWRVPGDSEAASFIELRPPHGQTLRVQITPPGADRPVATTEAGGSAYWPSEKAPKVVVINDSHRIDGYQMVLVRFAPTHVCSARAVAVAGDWKISVSGTPIVPSQARVHAYAMRAVGGVGSQVRGRQGRFVVDSSSKWRISAQGTLLGVSCGQHTIVVGGYVNWPQPNISLNIGLMPAPYTSAGPTRGARTTPDYSRPSEQSSSLPGMRSIGTRSSVQWRMGGTSIAVPQIARLLAEGACVPVSNSPPDLRLGLPWKLPCVYSPN